MAPFTTPGQEVSGADPFPAPACPADDRSRAGMRSPPQTAATWLTIQPNAAIKIGALEIIVACKVYFSFREAGLIP